MQKREKMAEILENLKKFKIFEFEYSFFARIVSHLPKNNILASYRPVLKLKTILYYFFGQF